MKGLTEQLPYRLRSFFGEPPEAAAAQLEQKTYLWALSYWLLTLYLPVFWVFQLALYCVWITDYNGHLLLRALPNVSLALVELLSGFTVVMLFWGASSMCKAVSSMQKALALNAIDGDLFKQMIAKPVVGFAGASVALAVSYCLRLSFFFLLIILLIFFFIAGLCAGGAPTSNRRAKAVSLFGPSAVGFAIALRAFLTFGCAGLSVPIGRECKPLEIFGMMVR
jgi:hypothetical protein